MISNYEKEEIAIHTIEGIQSFPKSKFTNSTRIQSSPSSVEPNFLISNNAASIVHQQIDFQEIRVLQLWIDSHKGYLQHNARDRVRGVLRAWILSRKGRE